MDPIAQAEEFGYSLLTEEPGRTCWQLGDSRARRPGTKAPTAFRRTSRQFFNVQLFWHDYSPALDAKRNGSATPWNLIRSTGLQQFKLSPCHKSEEFASLS